MKITPDCGPHCTRRRDTVEHHCKCEKCHGKKGKSRRVKGTRTA